jgi:hypothetical protein
MNIKDFAALWQKTESDINAHYETMLANAKREQEIRGCENHYSILDPSDHVRKKEIRDLARGFMRVLYGHAERHFAPVGGSLTIDREPIDEALGLDGRPEDLNVEALWNAIEEEYGGQKGVEASNSQMAAVLVHRFNLDSATAVKTVKGCMKLSMCIFVAEYERRGDGVGTLRTNSLDWVRSTFTALSTFALWGERRDLAQQLRNHPWSTIHGAKSQILTKERLTFGTSEIEVVIQKKAFEFIFSKEVGEELQVFISSYCPSSQQMAA